MVQIIIVVNDYSTLTDNVRVLVPVNVLVVCKTIKDYIYIFISN